MEEINIDNIYKTIGQNVAKYRKEAGLSQLELSLKLGYKSVSIVATAERYYNKKHFNLKHLYKIAYILNKKVCDFLP